LVSNFTRGIVNLVSINAFLVTWPY
jgi:hypothetical protein